MFPIICDAILFGRAGVVVMTSLFQDGATPSGCLLYLLHLRIPDKPEIPEPPAVLVLISNAKGCRGHPSRGRNLDRREARGMFGHSGPGPESCFMPGGAGRAGRRYSR